MFPAKGSIAVVVGMPGGRRPSTWAAVAIDDMGGRRSATWAAASTGNVDASEPRPSTIVSARTFT